MGKNKLERFAEMATFANVVQPSLDEVKDKDYPLKGNWNKGFFKNDNPIVLELGCGKGEYTLGLSAKYTNKNFLGIDIKGARIWGGAREALKNNRTNAGFLRTRIEQITSFFSKDEVSEIWITFPDPQEKRIRAKKRLTSSRFLPNYRKFLKPGGIVHLKTDNTILYEYTCRLAAHNKFNVLFSTADLYNSGLSDEILEIKTFYEQQYLAQGIPIKYIKFIIPHQAEITEPWENDKESS